MLAKVYADMRDYLLDQGFRVNPYREIAYGIQFMVFSDEESGLLRLFSGKKGLRVDLSQITSQILSQKLQIGLEVFLSEREGLQRLRQRAKSSEKAGDTFAKGSTADPDTLIGVDESGKGDYFGPLVIAGVYADPSLSKQLRSIGVADSKRLSADKIHTLSEQIRAMCPHSVVVLNNPTYNDAYQKIQNLNIMLAWGHARVIGNVLVQVPCRHALSDKFGPDHLIREALLKKNIDIVLFQRTQAEDNVAVAAASILARDFFVTYLADLGKRYGMIFPKGASEQVVHAKKQFLENHGESELTEVAKMHFKFKK